ncbi:MAG: restriction endonuclease subunit S [Elusimicrobia bacterium]|nr:restriction endonuclease subunit S [Elusimicrobiota bacterium]
MKKNWASAPLGEILIERREVPDAEALVSGEIPIISKISFKDGEIVLRSGGETRTGMILARNGDLLVSGINAAKGAIAIYEGEKPIAATIHYGAYIPNEGRIDVNYLWWLLRSQAFKDLLEKYVPGGIKTELKSKRFLPIPVPLPPLPEQRKIVARIEDVNDKNQRIKMLNTEIKKETELILSTVLSDIFSKAVKKGWQQGRLGNYVVKDCYGTSEKTTDDISGTPILRMGNIQKGKILLNGLKYLSLTDKEKNKLLLQKGDILVNRTNSAELVGKCAVFDYDGDFGFASYLIMLRVNKETADPYLVSYYVNSSLGRKYMLSEKKQMTGQANVNATKLKALPIALPTLKEQKKIAGFLKKIDGMVMDTEKLIHRSETKIDGLLSSVLNKAFKGDS